MLNLQYHTCEHILLGKKLRKKKGEALDKIISMLRAFTLLVTIL